MILNRIGATYTYEGVTYKLGDRVLANDKSEYDGLFGTIIEIRDGDDKETDNDTPDFYVEFLPPVFPAEIAELEDRFSKLYRQKKTLDDLSLDQVIMAPEMLQVIETQGCQKITLYLVCEEWVLDGERGENVFPAVGPEHAKLQMTELIHTDRTEGCIAKWTEHGEVDEDTGENCYECWLHDAYFENRYKVCIITGPIPISDTVFSAIGKAYIDRKFRADFAEQIECWEEISGLTDAQIADMIAQPCVPEQIRKQLRENGYLEESYWESVSEAAFKLVEQYIAHISGGGKHE